MQDDLYCSLPSGRSIVYRRPRLEPRPAGKPEIVYEHPHGERKLYGGLIVENVVQAICRDILADALIRLDAAGYEVVLHVHDEVVVQVDGESDLDVVRGFMLETPSWARGFPLAVAGGVSRRYVK